MSPLPYALLLLTFTTGLVDAVSFLGMSRVFTALMTGNVVFTAFAFAGAEGLSASRSLAALGAFLVGAAVGGRLARSMVGRTHRAWLSRSSAVEVGLVLGAASIGLAYPFPDRGPEAALYAAIALTAAAMGVRNASMVRLGVPDLKTTVLTLTLTGIAADSALAGGHSPRLGWRAASVAALFLGGLAGALICLSAGIALPLFLMAALVVLATAWYARSPASMTRLEAPRTGVAASASTRSQGSDR